jgi:hypothetical protein
MDLDLDLESIDEHDESICVKDEPSTPSPLQQMEQQVQSPSIVMSEKVNLSFNLNMVIFEIIFI